MRMTAFVTGTVAYWLMVVSIMFLFSTGTAVTDTTEKSLQQFTDPQATAQMDIMRKNHDLNLLVKSAIFIIAASVYIEYSISLLDKKGKIK